MIFDKQKMVNRKENQEKNTFWREIHKCMKTYIFIYKMLTFDYYPFFVSVVVVVVYFSHISIRNNPWQYIYIFDLFVFRFSQIQWMSLHTLWFICETIYKENFPYFLLSYIIIICHRPPEGVWAHKLETQSNRNNYHTTVCTAWKFVFGPYIEKP